jgi:hypothetical protein
MEADRWKASYIAQQQKAEQEHATALAHERYAAPVYALAASALRSAYFDQMYLVVVRFAAAD